jgi:O-antigen/teichoic acid export membrane protein
MLYSNLMKTISLVKRVCAPGAFTQNVTSTFLVQILCLFLSIANAAIIARWLGPEGKGTLALILLVPGMLALFLSGGIGVANVYFAGSRRLDVPSLTANSVGFAFVATILGIGVVGGLLITGWLETLVPGVPIWLVIIAMLGLPAGLLGGYFSTILQGLQHIVTVNLVNLAKAALTLVLTILLVIGFQLSLLGALVASLGAGAATVMVTVALLRREGATFTPLWDLSIMRPTFSFGLRGHIGNMLQFFNYRLDVFIVNYFLGPASVGIYIVSVMVTELLWYLPNAVGFVIFPKAAATRPEALNAFTPRVFRITLGLTALGALGLAVIGKPLIQVIFSSAFISAYVPMLVLLPGVVLLGGAKVLTNEIAGRGYPHYNSVNSGLALVLTVVLDLILIPRHGIVGAAVASSVAYAVIFFTAIGFYLTVSRRANEPTPVQVTIP